MSRALAGCVAFAWLLVSALALAHAVGLSRGDYARTERGLHVHWVFAQADLVAALPELDANRDDVIDVRELASAEARLRAFAEQGLFVTALGSACRLVQAASGLTVQQGVSLDVSFECGQSDGEISVELRFLKEFGREHRHRATGTDGSEAVYFGDNVTLTLHPSSENRKAEPAWFQLVGMGFWHILSGLDHVAFVVALLLSLRRPKTLLSVISSFTLGHSLSLALVTLDVWVVNSRWVEPAIALSIVYVALETARRRTPKYPALVGFGFGLVHGMGFAGALRELSLARAEIPAALLLFNAGVELGQLLLLAAFVPALRKLAQHEWFVRRGLPLCAGALAACGAFWFATRLA